MAGLDSHLAVGEFAQAQLGPLQVGQHRDGAAHQALDLAHVVDGAGVVGVGPVAEIDAEDVGAGERQLTDLFDAPAGGAKGRDDSGSAGAEHG